MRELILALLIGSHSILITMNYKKSLCLNFFYSLCSSQAQSGRSQCPAWKACPIPRQYWTLQNRSF